MSTNDLTAFLTARLDAREVPTALDEESRHVANCGAFVELCFCDCDEPAWQRAYIASTRLIVEKHDDGLNRACSTCDEPWPCNILRLLAFPYATHLDYRKEWRP